MAEKTHSEKAPSELADRAWELGEKIKFCMFTTWDGERQRMRPLTARMDREAHAIYFLVDVSGSENAQIERFPTVTLGFADPGKDDYLTIFGKAALSNDRAKIKELWTPFAKAWWSSADDPAIRLITVTPGEAELWDGPNRLVASAIMLIAAATGKRPPMGDHGQVRI